ncbi:hypothetical protein JNJ66_01490 [Candidatus Saccharibacteria bacterium]|nr:hypothetical protein [Candidatus Saccharibacteria bacterium]
MSQKKKRTKAYTGADAKASAKPTVHRYTAVDRGRAGQWIHERRTMLRRILLYGVGGAVAVWLLIDAIISIL